mgnify:FL=1
MKKTTEIKTIDKVVNKYKEVFINKEDNALKRQKKILKKLKKSEKEIENGEGIESDIAFKELRHKFGYWKIHSNNYTNSI